MHHSLKIGLKLSTTDFALIPEIYRIHDEFCDYVELYIIPNSYERAINHWKGLGVPYIIHAPHSFHGVNLAQEEKNNLNKRSFIESQRFADDLGSHAIIVHGGNNGSISETIRNLRCFDDQRISLENKPKMGLQGELCVGWSPLEFHQVSDAGALSGMTLDFGHATYAARSSGIDVKIMLSEFMKYQPRIFHLSDGYTDSEMDMHLNLGKGNLNISMFLDFIPAGGLLTIETPRSRETGLLDFINDVKFLRQIVEEKGNGFLQL